MNDTSDKKSLWRSKQGILTMIAAALTAITGLISVIYSFGVFDRKSVRPVPAMTSASRGPAVAVPSAQPTNQSSTLADTRSPVVRGCFEAYFSNVPSGRLRILEEGSRDVVLIGRDQNTEEIIGIKFTDSDQPVGALVFRFVSDGKIFKVVSIVDGSCNKVEEPAVRGRPGEKWTLQNRDTLHIPFGGHRYDLRLSAGEGTISAASFVRTAPWEAIVPNGGLGRFINK